MFDTSALPKAEVARSLPARPEGVKHGAPSETGMPLCFHLHSAPCPARLTVRTQVCYHGLRCSVMSVTLVETVRGDVAMSSPMLRCGASVIKRPGMANGMDAVSRRGYPRARKGPIDRHVQWITGVFFLLLCPSCPCCVRVFMSVDASVGPSTDDRCGRLIRVP